MGDQFWDGDVYALVGGDFIPHQYLFTFGSRVTWWIQWQIISGFWINHSLEGVDHHSRPCDRLKTPGQHRAVHTSTEDNPFLFKIQHKKLRGVLKLKMSTNFGSKVCWLWYYLNLITVSGVIYGYRKVCYCQLHQKREGFEHNPAQPIQWIWIWVRNGDSFCSIEGFWHSCHGSVYGIID